MPNQPRPENRHRMVRVEDDLWKAAGVAAREAGTTRSEVMREALRALVVGDQWIEWGVRRTWGPCEGDVSPLDYRTASVCAREWPGLLVKRTVVARDWEDASEG